MRPILLPALLWLAALQSSPESLIESLSSSDIQTRVKAAQKLLEQGTSAIPALKRAAGHADPEVAMHAKEILARIEIREQLTPALRALDGIELGLVQGGKPAWTALFLEAVPSLSAAAESGS